jgi:hypothetical protein
MLSPILRAAVAGWSRILILVPFGAGVHFDFIRDVNATKKLASKYRRVLARERLL